MTQPPNRNLLKETLQYIKNCGKTTNDILWVGSADGNYAISWNEFEKIADSTEYGRSGITPEIAADLVVVFNDEMWLSRKIISEIPIEEWQLNSTPEKQPHAKPFSRIIINNPNAGTKLHDYNFWQLMIVETVKNNIDRPLTSIWQFARAIEIIQISHETYRSKMFIT